MLVLVVGPSGAGKDTVLGLARAALAGDPRFHFARRVITRPADAGGEDHEAVSESVFAQRAFALRWQAHGLRYGIPLEVIGPLAQGVVVVANVSREVIAEAAGRFVTQVVVVTAPPAVLAARLAARGRETDADVMRRLGRDVAIPDHVGVETVVNDRTPQDAADHFTSILTDIVARRAPSAGVRANSASQ